MLKSFLWIVAIYLYGRLLTGKVSSNPVRYMAVCLLWVLYVCDFEVSVMRRLWPTRGYCTGGGGAGVSCHLLPQEICWYETKFFMIVIFYVPICSASFFLPNTMLLHYVARIKQIPSLGTYWVSWARWIHFTTSHHTSLRSMAILTLRHLMSYIYIYGAPILDVPRSHTTMQHSR